MTTAWESGKKSPEKQSNRMEVACYLKEQHGFAEMVKDYGEQELIFRKNIENAFHSHSDRVSFHDR